MKSFLLRLALFLLLLVVFGELFFRYVVVSSNTAYKILDPQFKILLDDTTGTREGCYTLGRLAETRVAWRTNRQGWKSPVDYEPRTANRRPTIALIGDSYVAGFQVEEPEHMAQVMENLLDHRWNVWSFGQGGSCCSQFVHVVRYVRARFDPNVYVILCRDGDWQQSTTHYVRDKNIWQIAWKDSHYVDVPPRFRSAWYRRAPKHSAIVRYFSYNANLDLFNSFRGGWEQPIAGRRRAPKKQLTAPPLKQAMEYLVNQLHEEVPDRPVVFMYDALRDRIYENGPPFSAHLVPTLRSIAGPLGISVLDLAPVFQADWNARHQRFSFAIDDHWNVHGHAVVARELCDYLKSEGILARADTAAGELSHEDSH